MKLDQILMGLAFERADQRRNTILIALAFVALGCAVRRTHGLSAPTHGDNDKLLQEVVRWREDLSW